LLLIFMVLLSACGDGTTDKEPAAFETQDQPTATARTATAR
jgi:hypothetical protein